MSKNSIISYFLKFQFHDYRRFDVSNDVVDMFRTTHVLGRFKHESDLAEKCEEKGRKEGN